MPAALPTRHDLQQQLLKARAWELRARRQQDPDQELLVEAECDRILDLLLASACE